MPARTLINTATPDLVRTIAILSADGQTLDLMRYTNLEVKAIFGKQAAALNAGGTIRHADGGLAFDVVMAGLRAHEAELARVRRVRT